MHIGKYKALMEEKEIYEQFALYDEFDVSVIHALDAIEISILFDENDKQEVYLEIHAGAGGIDAQDWANMLKDMYIKWLEGDKELKYEIIDISADEVGIKSAILLVTGNYPYGYLKHEHGIHRLVRISPFDSSNRRHTSFAAVSIFPKADEIDIDINPNDLRIDTYRSSGAGGQHVNTTDSAVRITHIPTGVTIQCQSERSQHKNKSTALSLLKNKLVRLSSVKQEQIKRDTYDAQVAIEWGNHIRSYILHPYQLVKDLRSKYEAHPNDILNGNLMNMIYSLLRMKVNI